MPVRKHIVEPVFDQIKRVRGFHKFLLRCLKLVSAEWQRICLTHTNSRFGDSLPATPDVLRHRCAPRSATTYGEHRERPPAKDTSQFSDRLLERLFPGTWSERAFKMLRNDLEAGGIPCITADGIADFHSLRHTFISNLAACGIHPKLAQQLARHSTIALTNGSLYPLGADRHELGPRIAPDHRRSRCEYDSSHRHDGRRPEFKLHKKLQRFSAT